MRRALINVQLYDFVNYIEHGFIIFDELIHQVGSMAEFPHFEGPIIDGNDQLVLPGFVCGHTHMYSAFARGLILPFNPKNFQDILDQMWWKLDRELDEKANYYSALFASSEFLKNGVTTIIDHHASGKQITNSLATLKEAINQVGIRAAYAFEVSDRFDVATSIDENVSFIEQNNNSLTQALFGLHASMSLSDETLTKVSAALNNVPIHIHVAESHDDVDDCLMKHHTRVVKRLDKFKLLTQDSLLVHAIHVDDEELAIIKNRACTIAVNVTSNMNNSVGLPDILKFMDLKIPVIIGNDGISWSMANEYIALYYAMHHRYQSPTAFTLNHLLTLINETYEYASRRFNVHLGRLMSGYQADFMLIPYQSPTPMDTTNAFGHLFFGIFPSLKPSDVYRGGQRLVKDGELSNTKLKQALAITPKIAQSIWNKLTKE